MKNRILTLILLAFVAFSGRLGAEDSVHFYRHLLFNHDSPNINYLGVDEISAEEASLVEHYEFHMNGQGKCTEIRNYSSELWHRHPLTHLGAFRTTFSYEGQQEIRRFYDAEGARVQNLRGVYEEICTYGDDGRKISLRFFNIDGTAMASEWGIACYTWETKGNLVIERRYDTEGRLVPLAPSFDFHISGIRYDPDGHFSEHYNLDDTLNVIDNSDGIACYKDLFSSSGRLLGLAYFNSKGELVSSPWGFAVVELAYDNDGNVIEETMLDAQGRIVGKHPFQYDERGCLLQE